jgi:ADP-ribose/FAD diphosphatase
MQTRVPEGDTHAREVCPACGVVEYRNPRMVVGVIVARGFGGGSASRAREVLLCRRAIEPARGRWTLPAGYLEVGESTAQGAQREALEETGADVEVLRPFAHFDVPAIGQAYLLFLARLQAGGRPPAASTPESLESRWFRVDSAGGGESGGGGGGGGDALEEVPWSELAFSSVSTALRLYAEDVAAAAAAAESGEEGADADAFPSARRYRQHHGVIERQPGAGPNQAGTYRLVDHTWSGGGGGR